VNEKGLGSGDETNSPAKPIEATNIYGKKPVRTSINMYLVPKEHLEGARFSLDSYL